MDIEKKEELFKVVLKMNPDVVTWYKQRAKFYGVPYTNYMNIVLTNVYEQEIEKELVKEFNSAIVDIKNMSDGSMTSEEMIRDMKKLVELVPKSDD